MSSIRADIYLQGTDEFKLFLEFEEKLESMRKVKYPQASALVGGLGCNQTACATAAQL